MNKFLFTCNLNQQSAAETTEKICAAVASTFSPNWCKFANVWVISAPITLTELRNWLMRFLGSNDTLLVLDISGKAAAWAGPGAQVAKTFIGEDECTAPL